jgi:hypothetical protein
VPEVLEDAENELTVRGRALIASLLEELRELEERIAPYGRAIEQASMESATCHRLRSIPGVGPIGATAVVRAGYPIVPNGAVSSNKPLITKHLISRETLGISPIFLTRKLLIDHWARKVIHSKAHQMAQTGKHP